MSKPAIFMTAVLLAGPLVVLPRPAEAAPASEPSTDPAQVRLVIDANALGDAAKFFSGAIAERLGPVFEDAGYKVTDKADADVTVRVRLSFYNEEDLDYQVDVDISAGSEIVRLETVGCPQCVDDDLLTKVDEQGAAMTDAIGKALAQARDADSTTEPPATQASEPEEVAPIGALGGVGIGVAVLGLGATVAGAVELSRGRVYDQPADGLELGYVDHRPPGAVLLGVGVPVFVAGAAMLIADVVIRSNKRKRRQEQTGTTYPLMGPDVVGLGYVRRF
ncbi:hypothetical protein ENSA5_70220 [Enhygromyxa salina]|uniref:Uncharacterized protein n=1 Tax=Enhygromyxa salina TaxID=215803 RepID=A0A2S9XAN3_9BACT|nr:hypothetical protein [Enhygromyxa salina]PRP89915.1 hypothetical protein ENSA5_70220 [Enhygromyxa salina]